jgi:hypothetical protein
VGSTHAEEQVSRGCRLLLFLISMVCIMTIFTIHNVLFVALFIDYNLVSLEVRLKITPNIVIVIT